MHTGLKSKNITLGVCGGIAAYKSVELLRLLQKAEARVRVVMTANARAFVGPLTFEALTGQPVCASLFERGADASIRHIEWAQNTDAVVIAPATANMLGKLAGGIADDALSTYLLAVTAPVVLCPSMNSNMYASRAVQRNLRTLAADGCIVLTPDSGQLACGTTGPGRLPEPADIVDRLTACLSSRDFLGRKVLVTAGPTHEAIDPVRFIGNPSSGRMGYAIARAAEHRGADVVLVSGPVELPAPINVTRVSVGSAQEMAEAVFEHAATAQIVIKAAAVGDYRPTRTAPQKIKKLEQRMTLTLEKNPDILRELGQRKGDRFLVGFAAETEALDAHATAKLTAKNLDMLAGNLVGDPASGFRAASNQVTLYYRDGSVEPLPLMDKEDVAHTLLDRIALRMGFAGDDR